MRVYVDSSALLRCVLGEPGALAELRRADRLVSSELIDVECRRTIDRLVRLEKLPQEHAASRLLVFSHWIEAIDLVLLRSPILARAGDPMPTPLGTLDAIHLATALVWRDRMGQSLTIATHDEALALAARAHGLLVIGA